MHIKLSISRFLIPGFLFLNVICIFPALGQNNLITVKESVTQFQQPPDYRLNYGPHVFQFGDLRLPAGEGPHPVVVIVHGGCWTARYDLHLMDGMAERLTQIGFATWNIEFRRTGQKDSAWPDTFTDVTLAVRYLENLLSKFNLDTDKIVLIGHSSGGHLALWLASQKFATKINIRGVVVLAGPTDLLQMETWIQEGEAKSKEPSDCGIALRELMGGTSATYPERYRAASPAHLPRYDIPLIVVSGDQDRIALSPLVEIYANALKKKGNNVQYFIVKQSGHFEMITPGTTAWSDIEKTVISLFK